MLLRFKFSNFRSFADEQELSLIAARGGENPEVVFHPAGVDEGVLGACAIYGANASGKSNTLKALQFMAQAVISSQQAWPPSRGILSLDQFISKRFETSHYEIDCIVQGVRYSYGFIADGERFHQEWLLAYPKGHKQTWFRREFGKSISFGSYLPGANRAIERLTRENSLFLSAAAQNGHEALLPLYNWFEKSILIFDEKRGNLPAQVLEDCDHADWFKDLVRLFLSVADVGIEDVQLIKVEAGLGAGSLKVKLSHRIGKEISLFDLQNESAGTVALLGLLGPVIHALVSGAVLGIDEMDASLHPLVTAQIIKLFNSPMNKQKAQLIFTTHDTNLLSSGNLRRDQVWFTEKNAQGESSLYPLSDFKPRLQENLEKGYLQGRYGGVPFLNADAFLTAFGDAHGKK